MEYLGVLNFARYIVTVVLSCSTGRTVPSGRKSKAYVKIDVVHVRVKS